MAEPTTGQIDQLIEKKIDAQIDKFVRHITDEITQFLKDNGDYDGGHLHVASEWEKDRHGTRQVKSLSYDSMYDVRKSLNAGLKMQVKQKMITKATKELLDKVSLLS
jgi:hypothetical protein